MLKGHKGHSEVLDSKTSWQMTDEFDIVLPVMAKWQRKKYIRDKIY